MIVNSIFGLIFSTAASEFKLDIHNIKSAFSYILLSGESPRGAGSFSRPAFHVTFSIILHTVIVILSITLMITIKHLSQVQLALFHVMSVVDDMIAIVAV